MIAFDQMGPLSLRPIAGAGWAPRGGPSATRDLSPPPRHALRVRRLRRPQRPPPRHGSGRADAAATTSPSWTRSAPLSRARRRIYWIQDNLSANWTPDIRAFAAGHQSSWSPTPTYASYLNPVECHFFPITEFVVNNADYLDWDAFAWALARHVCHRNGPHRDKRIRLLEARHQIAA